MAATKNISLDYQDVIVIGRRGENEAVDIVWDISPLVAEFGGGTALVLAKRATDESAYPVTLTEQTESALTWTVSSVDSCVIGVGKVQLFWYVGNVLAKSFMWRTFVGDDITGMVGDPPEAYESWLEHLAEMGADILNDAKAEVEKAEAWAVGERDGEPVVEGDETYHNNSKYWSGVSSDYAGNAEASADAAEQSAGDAAHQVELAEAQVTLAEAQVALAQQKVEDAAAQVALAEAQANAAAGSASDASGYALAASGYASDANTYKGQAYTSAQNAAQKASDAAGYASDALGYKNAASDSATLAGNKATEASGYANNASTYANNASGFADAASASADAAAASATEAAGYVASLVNGKAGALEDTASGDVVSIVPDKSVGKLYKAEVSLSPIQSLNGYDHPWAGGTGENKYDPNTVTAGFIGSNGAMDPQGPVNLEYISDYIPVSPSTQYTVMYSAYESSNAPYVAMCWYDSNKTFLRRDFSAGASYTHLSHENAAYCRAFMRTFGHGIDKCYFAVGTSTTFSPWQNFCPITGHTGATLNIGAEYPTPDESYPVTFPQTVYGGTFDFVSGKLVIDRALVDMGTFVWSATLISPLDGYRFYSTSIAYNAKTPESTSIKPNLVCSAYPVKYVSQYSAPVDGVTLYTNGSVQVYDASKKDMSAADFKTAMNGVQLAYELATPIVIDLDPTEVQTLQGLNNVWSDGEMSVDYAADLKTYIDNKIAAAVAALS